MSKQEVWQGTLALMVLKTLDVLGPQHGYGIAKRIEQISTDTVAVNAGTLYPVLLKLVQEDAIACEWGVSDKSQGIGRRLLERAEAFARAAGARECRIGVLARNEAARRLYLAAAFVPHLEIFSKRW